MTIANKGQPPRWQLLLGSDRAAAGSPDLAVTSRRRHGAAIHASSVSGSFRPRGAGYNPHPRFEAESREAIDDGWSDLPPPVTPRTTITFEKARTIITRNQSPDIAFDRSINPYRGCEHGCIYCYARPAHAYMGLSAGVDFETKLFAKPDAARLLAEELSRPCYHPRMIALGSNTDPYQPIEKRLRITRSILETLLRFRHPVGIVTKSILILRDLDLLCELAALNLVRVGISVTTLDPVLARAMEPRATAPAGRLKALDALAAASVPTMIMNAPIIPGLNEAEIEAILRAAYDVGVRHAGYVLLRLPREVAPLFEEWLLAHVPDRAARVLALIRSMRGGKLYDSRWYLRGRGSGAHADLIHQRFVKARRRLGYDDKWTKLATDQFRVPGRGETLQLL